MSQKESEWEKEFDKKFGVFSTNVNKRPLTSKSIKDFISQAIATAVSNREKEIAEEVESMALDKVGDSEATRKQILSILKH